MEETEVVVKPQTRPAKKDSPGNEPLQQEGAQEIKIEGEKWIRAPVKVLEPTFQPKINKRSKNLDRKADVVVLL